MIGNEGLPRIGGADIVKRHLASVVAGRLQEEPVVVLNGARTAGKSTLLRECAAEHGTPVLDLDDPATLSAVAADPSTFVSSAREPVCVDEFQRVLPLLDAIKAELNRELRPGRFLLTGSTRYTSLPITSQSLTGRAHVVTMWPLSQGELRGRRETFLAILVRDPASLLAAVSSTTTRSQYESALLAGGYPIALRRASEAARARWFRDYVGMVVERDVLEIRAIRQREVMPEIMRHLAAQTGQVVNASRIGEAVGLQRSVVGDYVELLQSVFLVHQLEAFGRTLSTRVRHHPKVHLVDSGLAAHLLGVSSERLARRDPVALTEFGHVVETFAVNEILKQAGWCDELLRFSHYRTRDGQEVDLVVETADGRIAGVEVKSAAAVDAADFRGLKQLRDRLGGAFVGGVALHLGQHAYRYDDRLFALPLDRLWA